MNPFEVSQKMKKKKNTKKATNHTNLRYQPREIFILNKKKMLFRSFSILYMGIVRFNLWFVQPLSLYIKSVNTKATMNLVYSSPFMLSLAFFFLGGKMAYWRRFLFFILLYTYNIWATLKKIINTTNCYNIFTIVKVLISYRPK